MDDLIQSDEVPKDLQTPPPKRRGRKRKQELIIEETYEVPEPSTSDSGLRSRRQRKQVNYYALANPDDFLEDGATKSSKTSHNPETEEKRPGRFRKSKVLQIGKDIVANGVIVESDVVNSEENNIQSPSSSSERVEPNERSSIKDDESVLNNSSNSESVGSEKLDNNIKENGNCERALVETVRASVREANNKSESEVFAAITSSRAKGKKYKYHGQTVKMMNTLFTMFKGEGSTTSEDSVNKTAEQPVPVPRPKKKIDGRGRYKRKKKEEVSQPSNTEDIQDRPTCAVCNVTVDKTLWSHHKQRYHNNLAWRVGDPPLDLSDQTLVMYTLNALYKKKKPLYCDKCGEVKKSVVGFLSHQSQCKKSEEQLEDVKVSCELCGKKMLPVSLMTHMKFVHTNPKKKEDDEKTSNNEDHVKTYLPSKRNAARKALQIIEKVTKNDLSQAKLFTSNLDFGAQIFAKKVLEKELLRSQKVTCKFEGCKFEIDDVEEALKHLEECSNRPSGGFACKECLLVLKEMEDIIYHIELAHDLRVPVDVDYDSPDKGSINKLPSFLETSSKKFDRNLFEKAFAWTLKFQEENYSELAFENLPCKQTDWLLLPFNKVEDYLPKMNESCDVARTFINSFANRLGDDHVFKRYELFESELHDDGKHTIFCGGPVTSIAWMPTPYTEPAANQVLAVSILNSPDEVYRNNENYHVPSAIQFWNIGPLANREGPCLQAKLAFNLALNHGPVWHMEWCPSRCYNPGEEKLSRMGLLAVACSDSVVYIYSIPFFKDNDDGLYYKPKPVLKLMLQRPESSLFGGLKYYPSKLSWTKASGHTYIAVGYTNGFVGIYNLKTKSFLLKQKDVDGVNYILPYKSAQVHNQAVTTIALHHMRGGNRWLMTASLDRKANLWDLDNFTYPVCTYKKNIVTDGFWFTNWLCYFLSFDEASTTLNVNTCCKPVRDFMSDSNVTMMLSPSTITSVAGSDWLNGIIQANTVGEITAVFPHQMFYIPDHCKFLKKKRLLFGYTQLVEKHKPPKQRFDESKSKKKILLNSLSKKATTGITYTSTLKGEFEKLCDEPVLYHEAEKKYGLLFCDNRMQLYSSDFPETTCDQLTMASKAYNLSRPNLYPLNSINKIAFNPNRQASLYYATGYQAGFVRVSWMEFLKDDPQIQ